MKQMIKKEKGITLVALVITIIVLVILVGVTINTIINKNLVAQASNATYAYKTEQTDEEIMMEEYNRWTKTGEVQHYHYYKYVDNDTKVKCYCGEEKEVSDDTYFDITDTGVLSASETNLFEGTDLVIPKKVKGIEVKQISSTTNGYFKNFTNLQSVVIPEGVTTITNGAFGNSSSLKSVFIPKGVETITNAAFGNCSSLELVMIYGDVGNIINGAFNQCNSLSNVILLGAVENFGPGSFSSCSSLTTIVFKEGCEKIGTGAFAGTSLKEIELPHSITELYAGALAVSTIEKIKVNMTIEEWNSVTKEANWAMNVRATKVECIDGEVAI